MNYKNLIFIFALGVISPQVLAYGSSSSTKACTKPHFSEFSPSDKAEVAPQSAFSFLASSATNPKSIKVEIKNQTVEIKVTEKGQGYQVTGTLPGNLKGTSARININAETLSKCKGNDGWLIKIGS